MQSRKRVWLLFTAVIIAVFAMVGCIPEITPDKTPPKVTAKTATLSATTIEQGDTLTVTVEVTAEDKRSNLKNAQIRLLMQKPGENGFSEVDSITKPFAEKVKTGTVSNAFELVGSNFNVGGTYNFKAEIWVSDVKDNTSQEPAEVPTTSLTVEGAGPVEPVITIEFDPEPIEVYPDEPGVLPETFDITVRGTHTEADLAYLKAEIYFQGGEEDPEWSNYVELSGSTQIELSEEDITIDIGDSLQEDIHLKIVLKDKDGNPLPIKDASDNDVEVTQYTISKTDIAFINQEWHVGDERIVENAQSIGNYEEDEDPSVIPTESPTVYELPFGITTLTFDVYPSQAIPTNMAKVFIYSEPEDIFLQEDQFKRGESSQIENLGGGNYRASIEFANLSADNAKWLALFIEGAAKPWYVWKISAADHVTTPQVILKDFGTIEEFIEGKPIEVQLNLKDELLLSLEDLRIQFLNNQETSYLEELIYNLNQQLPQDAQSTLGWPTDDSWRFAVRYHAKVTFENYPEAFEDIRKRDLEPDPDPKTVYAISDPVYLYDGTPPSHSWQRYDADTGVKVNWNNNFITNDMLYFFGVPDRQIEGLNRPEYITDLATMTVHVYPEFVVVHKDS
ncbi:MAG: hypothetical protein U9N62_02480, partial [Thermotogota bacterium]|nr:hypothetical protein [Thermotogota bacterium]